jgi:hypothetical protein
LHLLRGVIYSIKDYPNNKHPKSPENKFHFWFEICEGLSL